MRGGMSIDCVMNAVGRILEHTKERKKKMQINHDKTKEVLFSILTFIKEYAKSVESNKASTKSILTDETLSEKTKNERVEKLRVEYNKAFNEAKTFLSEKYDKIEEIETENENILELDVPEFSNTYSVLSGDVIPWGILPDVVKNFAGQHKVLLIFSELLEGKALTDTDNEYYNKLKAYAEDVTSALFPIRDKTLNLEQSSDALTYSLYKLFEDIITFSEMHGIYFSDEQKAFGIDMSEDSEHMTNFMRKVMNI